MILAAAAPTMSFYCLKCPDCQAGNLHIQDMPPLMEKAIGYLEIILDITNASTRMGVAVPPKEIIIFILCNTANSSNFFSED